DSLAALDGLLAVQLAIGLPAETASITLADSLVPPPDLAPAPAGEPLRVAAAAAALRSEDRSLALAHRSVIPAPSLQLGVERGDGVASVCRGRQSPRQRARGAAQRTRGAGPLHRRCRRGERRGRRCAPGHCLRRRAVRRLLALLAVAAACRDRAGADDAESARAQAAVAAQTAVATAQPFPRIVRAIGTVTPRPGRFAELAAPAPTRVARIFVTPGQRVAEGDTLIEFERAPFDATAQSAATALAAEPR